MSARARSGKPWCRVSFPKARSGAAGAGRAEPVIISPMTNPRRDTHYDSPVDAEFAAEPKVVLGNARARRELRSLADLYEEWDGVRACLTVPMHRPKTIDR